MVYAREFSRVGERFEESVFFFFLFGAKTAGVGGKKTRRFEEGFCFRSQKSTTRECRVISLPLSFCKENESEEEHDALLRNTHEEKSFGRVYVVCRQML